MHYKKITKKMLHKIYNQLGCYLFHNLKLKFDYSLYLCTHIMCLCFPGGSEVKASACNAGNLGSIPGSGRSPGEGNCIDAEHTFDKPDVDSRPKCS